MAHEEFHHGHRVGWLRASVLGANDGLVSTASLVLGVASAQASHGSVLIAGLAGLVEGAMAMAAGEYVSVSSQADTERADLAKESHALTTDHAGEHLELAQIYVERGLSAELAHEVARQVMAHDALGAHARDELGISEVLRARPLQAALASAASFVVGAVLPMLIVVLSPEGVLIPSVTGGSLVFLAVVGAVAARAGGAPMLRGAARVLIWGALAMAMTAGVGALIGTPV